MKKISILITFALLCCIVSCSNEEFNKIDNYKAQVISAFLEQTNTRVNIQDDYSLIWTNDEYFVAYEKDNTAKSYVFSNKESGNEAVFTSDLSKSVLLDYAVYPNRVQTIHNDILSMELPSYDFYNKTIGIGIPMYGHISDGKVKFSHLTGVLKIALNDCPDWAYSVKITASSPISGTFTADLKDNSPKLLSSSIDDYNKSVIMDFSGSDSIVYIPLPAQKYDSITVILNSRDGKSAELVRWKNKEVEVGYIYTASLTYPISADEIYSLLDEAYTSFTENNIFGVLSLDNYLFGDIAGGDANKGSTYADQPDLRDIETYLINAQNPYLLEKWKLFYKSVKKANQLLDLATKLNRDSNEYDYIIGQAKFIKALWMFEGIRLFGAAIPYISLEDYHNDNNYMGSNKDESGNYIYIWDLVEDDLKDATNKLPQTWAAGNYDRPNCWAAKAMLAKLYVYWSSPYNGKNGNSNHWGLAREIIDDIIANGTTTKGYKYRLAETYGDLFNLYYPFRYTDETIFTVAFNQSTATLPPGGLGVAGWGFYQPTREFVNSYIVDAYGLPLPDYTEYNPLSTVNDDYDVSSDTETYVDPRLDFCVGRIGVPYLDYGIPTNLVGWVRDFNNGGPYINIKFQLKKDYIYMSSLNTEPTKVYPVIRLADILLLRAECAIEEGNLATALNYINQVRTRAANDYVRNESVLRLMDDRVYGKTCSDAAANYRIGLYKAFSNYLEAHTALERERRAEFGMEGHRWFDIARWGKASDVLNKFQEYEGKYMPNKYVNNYDERWVTFPIPQTIIDESNGDIVQNVNWK